MKLQNKILMLVSSLALVLGAPLLLTVKNTVHRILIENIARRGVLLAESVAQESAPGLQQNSETLLLPILQSAQDLSGALYVMALDTAGKVVAHTNVAERGRIYTNDGSGSSSKIPEPRTQILRYKEEDIMDMSMPVWSAAPANSTENFLLLGLADKTQKKWIGTVHLALSLKKTNAIEYHLFRRIAWIVFIAGGVGIILILWLMRILLRPIPLLSAAASQIGRGEYGASVPVLSKDELGTLAQDFNLMSKALAETTVSKDFMSNILDNLLDPLLVMAPDTTLLIVNPAVTNILGYSREDLIGKPLAVLTPSGSQWQREDKQNTFLKSTLKNMDLNLTAKNGTLVPILFSSAVIRNSQNKVTHIIAIVKDMTERKQLEMQLLQTGKLSAVGQLAGGVAHEINNPLGVILGFAQGLLRRLPPGDAFEMPLKAVEREAIRCKNLVQDLLTFSRTSSVDREPMDLNQAIEGALSLVMAQARLGQIQVQKKLAVELPRILGHPNQVQQIIINLANNALDAMGKQGTLTLRTEFQKTAPRSWVCLYVADTGSGIPPEVLPRIFEPFFTTKPVGQGTGLGLGLVHEIVQKHSGTIDVQSRPGFTEFCIKFPARDTMKGTP
jgi:PAS domain S-box-containing protein